MTAKRYVAIVMSILLVLGLSLPLACAKPAPSPAPAPAPAPKPAPAPAPAPWPKALRASCPPSGSGAHNYTVTISSIIEKATGVVISPQPTGSGSEASALFNKGEVEAYVVSPDEPYYFYEGDGAGVVRVLVAGYNAIGNFMTRADSDIKTIPDLKGKRCMFRRPGQRAYELVWSSVLKAYGLTEEDITVMPALGQKDAAQALKEGTADAFFHWSGAPAPAFTEVDKSTPLRLIPIDPAKARELTKKELPFAVPWMVKGGTYQGTTEDTPALAWNVWYALRKDLPDDFVYAAAKAMIEHIDDFRAAHASFKNKTVEDLIADPVVPYHAGAYKYYKEAGLLKPEWEQKHKDLLAAQGQQK
ncbi:TAXI family TRAP transporter solute-binding subunit [Chloroflexota bacterium]